MRKNTIQAKTIDSNGRTRIIEDWYPKSLPKNIVLSETVYIETAYGFKSFKSKKPPGLFMDEASGCYGIVTVEVGEFGIISVGKFSVLNSTTLICTNKITIGNHCMLAWGSVVTDSWLNPADFPLNVRRNLLYRAAENPARTFPLSGHNSPVTIDDNCWVGFGAVIMPGVTLGRGCVIGCKTIISESVPPYAVVAGSPAKIIKYLNADDVVSTNNEQVSVLS